MNDEETMPGSSVPRDVVAEMRKLANDAGAQIDGVHYLVVLDWADRLDASRAEPREGDRLESDEAKRTNRGAGETDSERDDLVGQSKGRACSFGEEAGGSSAQAIPLDPSEGEADERVTLYRCTECGHVQDDRHSHLHSRNGVNTKGYKTEPERFIPERLLAEEREARARGEQRLEAFVAAYDRECEEYGTPFNFALRDVRRAALSTEGDE